MKERRQGGLKLDAGRLDAALARLAQIAVANGRCPPNEDIGHGVISALAAAGSIEVEIYGRNFRRVTLLTGPHAGATTAPPPGPWQPYAVTDRSGTRRIPAIPPIRRMPPSAPRALTAHELDRAI